MASEREGDAGDEQGWGFPITCIFSLPDHVPVRQLWKLPVTGPFFGAYWGQSSESCCGFLLQVGTREGWHWQGRRRGMF